MLFQIQDSDRPMYVVASGWAEALAKWQALIKSENYTKFEDLLPYTPDQPQGIQLIATDDEIIL